MRASITTGLLGLWSFLLLAGCGGGAAGYLTSSAAPQAGAPTTGLSGAVGAALDGFEVVRYNPRGFADGALNGTLRLSYAGGDEYALTISVRDADFTTAVCLDVCYDATLLHPVRAEFHRLLGDEAQSLTAAILDHGGVAALGEVAIGDYVPPALDGPFATVYFAPGAARGVSAAGDPHQGVQGIARVIGGVPNLVVDNLPTYTAKLTWYAGWHAGDGDQNSEVNIADVTPIGQNLLIKPFTDDTSWWAIVADYNCEAAVNPNSQVTVIDVTEVGRYFHQRTSEYLVEISDNQAGAARTEVTVIPWGSEPTPRQRGVSPVLGELDTVFRTWSVDFLNDPGLAVHLEDLPLFDTNGDGYVTVHITPRVPGAVQEEGITISRDLEVVFSDDFVDDLIIQELDVRVVGATGGGAGGDIFDLANLAGTVVANREISYAVNSLNGLYIPMNSTEPVAFHGPDLDPGQYPNFTFQYQAALTAAQAATEWTISSGPGAIGFRHAGEWLEPAAAQSGPVFADDDPESDTAAPEGHLNARLAYTGAAPLYEDLGLAVYVIPEDGHDFQLPLAFDVTSDAAAAELSDYLLNGSPTATSFRRPQASDFVINLDWGGVEPAALDLTATQLQILGLPPDGDCDPQAGTTIDFTYEDFVVTPENPAPALDAGEFTVEEAAGDYRIHAVVPGLLLLPDAEYVVRFHNTLAWSSLNRPDWTFDASWGGLEPFALSIPESFGTGDKYNILQIYLTNPLVNRWSGAEPDGINGGIDYHGHEADFSDVLKTSGGFFTLEAEAGVGVWPSLIIVSGDVDAGYIDWDDARNLAGMFSVVKREFGRIVVDVAAIPRPTESADPTWDYTYALFDRAHGLTFAGDFTTEYADPTWDTLTAVNWGVDAWDREGGAYGTQDYSGKTVDGATIGTATPDVLWFEWHGGFVSDWNYGLDEDQPTRNVRVVAEDLAFAGITLELPVLLKIAGITPSGNYIGIHPVRAADFFDAADPLSPGIFETDHQYSLTLADPTGSGLTRLYDTTLTISGPNPNS